MKKIRIEQEEIKVEQFEYIKTEAPNILISGGLGPCIAIGAIYENKGYLAHYPYYLSGEKLINLLLDDLDKDVKDIKKLRIFIAGAGIDTIDYLDIKEDIEKNKKNTLEKIANSKYKGANIETRWARGNSTQELILDLYKNEVTYEEEFDEDY